jgi:photosystem II stability/assembly factor-like uncharacterized protein
MKRIYSLRRLIKQSYSQKVNLNKGDKSSKTTGIEHFLLIVLLSFNLLLVSSDISFTQVFENWNTRFTGPGNGRDEPVAIAIDNNQNIHVGGYGYYSVGNGFDYIVIKYNICGNVIWNRWYNYGDDFAGDLTLDGSGNVLITGGVQSSFFSFGTVKYNSSGTFIWDRRQGGPFGGVYSDAKKIITDAQGSSYVSGVTLQSENPLSPFNVMTVKYDQNGVLQWQLYYNGPGDAEDKPEAICIDSQGKIYVAGGSEGNGTSFDFFVLRYTPGGILDLTLRYNGEASGSDAALSVSVDNSGNIYVTGISQEYETPQDGPGQNTLTTLKYDNNGQLQWVRKYFGTGNPRYASGKTVKAYGSNEIYVSGYANEYSSGNDFITIKYDASGNQTWIRKYNSESTKDDRSVAMCNDSYGNVVATGSSMVTDSLNSSNYLTVKYNSSGNLIWAKSYNGPDNLRDIPVALSTFGNAVYVTGKSEDSVSNFDIVTIRYSNEWLACDVEESVKPALNALHILNKDTAFVAGENGYFGKTTDKGLHWSYINIGTEAELTALNFRKNVGVLIAVDSTIFVTTNHGEDWRRIEFPSLDLRSIVFSSDSTAVLSCSNGRIIKSKDLFRTFSVSATPSSSEIMGIHFADDISGVLFDKNGLLAKTTNGGSNWTAIGWANAGTINDVIIRNQDIIYAVGDLGKTVRTSDGGFTWQDISIQTDSKLSSIFSWEWNELYAGGSKGSIFFSSDDGGSWEKQPAQTSLDVIDIGFFDDNCGIAITAGGEVLKTSLGLLESGNQAGDGDNSLIVSKDEVEDNFSLIGNYPNPFNPKTTITFKIPERGFVEIEIYDVLGKEVRHYPKNLFEGGRNSIEFDGSNLATGAYFYKLNFGSFTKLGRMVLVK